MSEDTASDPNLIEGLSVRALLDSFSGRVPPADQPEPEWAGRQLGPYELLEEIDRGGMGIVFRARQATLDRTVAVKVLRAGGFAGEDEVARFQDEALVLGHLEHPNIVAVYDVGEVDGSPYLAMQFVEGGCLLEHARRFREDPRFAVEVLAKVASAVHEAHRRGILHRDLKPANILLDSNDEPRVTDFGLARRIGVQSSLTVTGAVIGSPNYICPELAAGDEEEVTTAADVYGLGAVLYHLITGRPPFEGDNPVAVLKAVTEDDPPRPSRLNAKVDRDLETICLTCLDRDPQRRYSSAAAFIKDLERWQEKRPIEARPAGNLERMRKWARRHPVLALLNLLVLLAIGGFVALDARYQAELRVSRDKAREGEREAREANRQMQLALIASRLDRAEQEFAAGRQQRGIAHLLEVLEDNPTHRVAAERLHHEWSRRGFALPVTEFEAPEVPQVLLAVSEDGSTCAGAGRGSVHAWNAEDGALLMPALAWPQQAIAVGLSWDGSHVMAASKNRIRVWSVPEGKARLDWPLPAGQVLDAVLTPAGDRVHVATSAQILTLEVDSGAALSQFRHGQRLAPAGIALAARRNLLVSAGATKLRWWDLESSTMLEESDVDPITQMAFSADESRLVTITRRSHSQVWDVEERTALAEPRRHLTIIHDATLDAAGERLAIAFVAGRVEVLDVENHQLVLDPIVEDGQIAAASFQPGEDRLLTTSTMGVVRAWDLAVAAEPASPPGHYISTFTAFGPRDRFRLQRNRKFRSHLSRVDQRVELAFGDQENIWHFAVAPDGKEFAVAVVDGRAGRVELFDPDTLERKALPLRKNGNLFLHYSPDGKVLVLTSDQGGMAIWDRTKEELRCTNPQFPSLRDLVFHPNGKSMLARNGRSRLFQWSLETGKKEAQLLDHEGALAGLAINAEGSMILTGGMSNRFRWWTFEDGEARQAGEARFGGAVNWASFNPGGEDLFLAGSRDGTVRVWDTATGRELCRIEGHELPLTHAAFTADGEHVRTVSMEGYARIWDARTGYPVTAPLRHDEWWELPADSGDGAGDWIAEIADRMPLFRRGAVR